jgi:lipoprotein NlpD
MTLLSKIRACETRAGKYQSGKANWWSDELFNLSASRRLFRFGFAASYLCLVTACTHAHKPAPVVDINSSSANYAISSKQANSHKPIETNTASLKGHYSNKALPKNNLYKVKAGDTLFSIAWEHGLNHQEIIRINQLKNNNIFVGQKLRLTEEFNGPVFEASSLIAALNRDVLKKPVSLTHYKPDSLQASSQKSSTSSKAGVSQVAALEKPRVSSKPKRNNSSSSKTINWIWPTDGKVINNFSASKHKGLAIAVKKGQPVRASAPGKVVYKGHGLRGYGNLIIIKHNNNYLSAYAHNDKIYVNENEYVKAGQKVADAGSSGSQSDKLYFEIRYKSKPVDPLNYLPKQ